MEKQSYYDSYDRTQYEDIAMKFSQRKNVQARYIRPSDCFDLGNKLIEALPPLRTVQECFDDFEKNPFWSPEMRRKDKNERRSLVSHLSEFRIARDFIAAVGEENHRAMVQCYRLRRKRMDIVSNSELLNHYLVMEGKVPGALIAGGSGTGKTTTVIHALNYYPQVIIHEFQDSRMYQVTYIKVECPADGSIKNFFDLCLEELEQAVGYELKKYSYKTADAKEGLFRHQAARFNLGILVIDEIQNLLSSKNKNIMKYFLTLSNETKIPLVFVGTNEIMDYLKNSNFFIQRRIGREIHVMRFEWMQSGRIF